MRAPSEWKGLTSMLAGPILLTVKKKKRCKRFRMLSWENGRLTKETQHLNSVLLFIFAANTSPHPGDHNISIIVFLCGQKATEKLISVHRRFWRLLCF